VTSDATHIPELFSKRCETTQYASSNVSNRDDAHEDVLEDFMVEAWNLVEGF
jgi:hypothetical protein